MSTRIGYRDSANQEKWWLEKNNVFESVYEQCKLLIDNQAYNYDRNLSFLKLYSQREFCGLTGKTYAPKNIQGSLKRNVIKNCVDTLSAKIGTEKIKPMFLTVDGDQSAKTRAKLLNQFVLGMHMATKLHRKARQVFKDGSIFWRGFLKVFAEAGNVCVERVLPTEIIVDDEECLYGEPRMLFQVKELSKNYLTKYLKKKFDIVGLDDEIQAADLIRADNNVGSGLSDNCTVIEAWHLPSADDEKDGRHVVCISTATIIDEPWEIERFPFASFTVSPPAVGWRGHSIPEQLEAIQREINLLLQKAQRESHLAGFHVFAPKGTMVNKANLTNQSGSVIEYAGNTPPVQMNAQAVSPETFLQIDRLVQQAREEIGVSQQSMTGSQQPGMTAGKAIRESQEIESERFKEIKSDYSDFIMDATELMIAMAKSLDGYEVKGRTKEGIKNLKWSEVDLDRDKYIMMAMPTNFLSATPGGKWEDVQDMIKTGFIGREDASELMDFPDINSVMKRINAPRRLVEHDIEEMIEHGRPRSPTPFYNLVLAGKMGTEALSDAELDGAPEEHLDLLRNYIAQVKELQAQSMQAQQTMPGAPISPEQQQNMGGNNPMSGMAQGQTAMETLQPGA